LTRQKQITSAGHLANNCQTQRQLPGLVGGCLEISAIGFALSEVKRDLVKRALFPLFRFGQPENSALGIQQRPLSAYKFLVANFDELVHELHS
jgi:hypothetical protein